MSSLSNTQIEEMQNLKVQIRCLISNIYDLQKLRIGAGNRLVQSFYIQLGIKPSESPDDAEKAEKKLIDRLKWEYSRISDAVAEKNKTVKSVINSLREEKSDKEEDVLTYVRNELDYKLIRSYMLLLEAEEDATKVLDKYVKSHPLWDAFFKDIKGCGPLMSAVCIAYFDIRKARYVSSFYRYAGLDTVRDTDENGNVLFVTVEESPRKVREKIKYSYKCDGSEYTGKVIYTEQYDEEGIQLVTSNTGEHLTWEALVRDGQQVYEDVKTGEEYVGDVYLSEHGRRMGDTEMFEYIDKNGKPATKRGITYNPVLKTKLMGVLTGCLLKAKDPTYSTIYYDYRKRLDGNNKYNNCSVFHKSMMSQRYMIKQFLRNLWTTWRTLEGLEVNYPYEVAKLGHAPHKYNQYQCDKADEWDKKGSKVAN